MAQTGTNNHATNPSAEDCPGGKPAGWSLALDQGQADFGVTNLAPHTGTKCLFFRTFDWDVSCQDVSGIKASFLNTPGQGQDGAQALAVPGNCKCVVRFWARGDSGNGLQPTLYVRLWTWTNQTATVEGRAVQPAFPVELSAEWAEYEVYFYTGNALRVTPGFSLHIPGATDALPVPMELMDISEPAFTSMGASATGGDPKQDGNDDPPMPGNDAATAAGGLKKQKTVYLDDLTVTFEPAGIPAGLTIEGIRAGCEERITPAWWDTMTQPELVISEVPEGTPLTFPDVEMKRPMYDPLPEGWKELDLGGNWRIRKLQDTVLSSSDDTGTLQGFWKPEFDDTAWAVRPVPSYWNNEARPYPDRDLGFWDDSDGSGRLGWYRTQFKLPGDFKGRRIVLQFEAAASTVTPYVNGRQIGERSAVAALHEFDITDAVRFDGGNVLAVRVFDARLHARIDARHPAGGLFNRVVVHARPDVYVSRQLLNPRLKESRLDVEVTLVNAGNADRAIELVARVAPDPNQAGCVVGEGRASSKALGKHTLKPGENTIRVQIPLENPVFWSDTNAFLHVLRLETDGAVIGKERFGFREFRREGRYFLLNGKRVLLRGGHGPDFGGIKAIEIENRNQVMRRVILARKAMHHNCFMPMGTANASNRQQYDLYDELGILIYDWAGKAQADEDWFYARYNHPSVVMYALGNETCSREMYNPLRLAYLALRRMDGQGRPVCAVSGGAPEIVAPPTDVADARLQPGDFEGHPLQAGPLLAAFNTRAWVCYRDNMPVLCWGMGGNRIPAEPEFVREGRRLLRDEPIGFKDKLVYQIEFDRPDYGMPMNLRWLALYGIRRYVIDDYNAAEKSGLITKEPVSLYSGLENARTRWCAKNITEECRRLGDLIQGYGHDWLEMNGVGVNSLENSRPVTRYTRRVGMEYVSGALVASGLFSEYARVSNPTFICLNAFDRNVTGGTRLAATVFAINDRPEPSAPWRARAVVRDLAGRRLADVTAELGAVSGFKRKLANLEWPVPTNLPTGLYRIELFLLEGGKTLSDNYYPFFVMGPSELVQSLAPTGRRVALYDVKAATNAAGGITTAKALDALKVPYERIAGFDDMGRFDVLIVGARSADEKFFAAGPTVGAWLEKGGRMLQFEQSPDPRRPLKVGCIPQFDIVLRQPGVVADMIDLAHPVFEGLRRVENWEQWNGVLPESGFPGVVYLALISPLNRTVVATGIQAGPRDTNKAVQMLMAEVRIGRGLAFLSQAEAIRRFETDCVAARFVRNAISHILSGESRFARTLSGYEIENVDPGRCGYVDLGSLAADELEAVPDAWYKTVIGGNPDCGTLRFRIPGRRVFIVDSVASKLEGDSLSFDLPRDSRLMKAGPDKIEAVYFLHKAEELKEFESIGKYIFHYKDGGRVEESILENVNIGCPEKTGDLSGAKNVGQGFWVTRWVNPNPDKELGRLEIRITSPTARLTVGGITTYLVWR